MAAFEWVKCAVCGHTLCKATAGLVVAKALSPRAIVELFCRSCKQMNYLETR